VKIIFDGKSYDSMVFVESNPGRASVMTMFDFQQLPQDEQVATLYDQGVYLGKRKEKNQAVLLYQYESFYVEVFYSIYRQFISKIHLSVNTVILDPYLEQIDVEDLVNEL
jgi:hypothetical protein